MRSTINLILFAFLLLSCELTVYGAKCPPTNDEGEALGEMLSECYDKNNRLIACPYSNNIKRCFEHHVCVETELGSELYECKLGEINVDCSVGQIMCV